VDSRVAMAKRKDVFVLDDEPLDSGMVGPIQAVTRRPLVLILPILVLLVPALALAFMRTPMYTSQARLVVGDFSFSSQAVPGYVLAAQDLAGTYSRLASEGVVVQETAHRLGIAPGRVQRAVSASPIVGSSVIIVTASDHDEQIATSIAGTTATVLTEVTKSYGKASSDLLKQYVQANVDEQRASHSMTAANSAYETARAIFGSGAEQTKAAFNRMLLARATFQSAQLRVNSIGSAYQQAQSNDASSGGAVQLISPAVPVGSDRRSKIELAIIAPILAGSVIGAALATFLANRRRVVRA